MPTSNQFFPYFFPPFFFSPFARSNDNTSRVPTFPQSADHSSLVSPSDPQISLSIVHEVRDIRDFFLREKFSQLTTSQQTKSSLLLDLNKASTRCCPVSLPPASRCNCPPPLSARGSPNSETGSRTTGNKGCWAGRRASGSSCRNSVRILAPRERGSPSCSNPWTGIWVTRSPGTSDSAYPTSGCSTGRAGRTGPSSSSLGPLVSFGKKKERSTVAFSF